MRACRSVARSIPPPSSSATSPASARPPEVLDDLERRVLDFERGAWGLQVAKDRAIRETFGFSTTRYHQVLHRALDRPAALAYDPMLVRRPRRRRRRTCSSWR